MNKIQTSEQPAVRCMTWLDEWVDVPKTVSKCPECDDSVQRMGRVLVESWERRIEALENRPMRTYADQDLALGIQECLDDLRAYMEKHSTVGSEPPLAARKGNE